VICCKLLTGKVEEVKGGRRGREERGGGVLKLNSPNSILEN
jgi:hypothetical protein